MVFYVYADLCSLLAATSQFSILIGQNMQLTSCHNGNEMRNATCADTQISIEWPYCSFPILWHRLFIVRDSKSQKPYNYALLRKRLTCIGNFYGLLLVLITKGKRQLNKSPVSHSCSHNLCNNAGIHTFRLCRIHFL